ncbi:hypothetical protein [Streptomyces fragilis]|uniref:hypothetical protein n=1 Tax=Streptomyces fragilis TaxID=67301 RepID=UPI0024DEF6A6|nr:hypothetical protein [Streptomyces fragilis]
MGRSQTSLLMAVGRYPAVSGGPAEGERASDGLRCARVGTPVPTRHRGAPYAVAQTSRCLLYTSRCV